MYICQPYFRLLPGIHKPFVVTFFFKLSELRVEGSLFFKEMIAPDVSC
jgi:hypothetical protein